MYSFLVTAETGAWDGTGYEIPFGRFLEYTDDDTASRFRELGNKQIEALKKIPCLFAYEGKTHAMRVGRLTRVRLRERMIYIEWAFDRTIPPIEFASIRPYQGALDIRDWELNRTHWAIKDEDLVDVLVRHQIIVQQGVTENVEKASLPPPSEPTQKTDSVGDFVAKVLALNPTRKETFYRGHSRQAKYRLEPSVFRKDGKGNFIYLDNEDRMYRELLVSNAVDFEGDVYTLDRLVRMQHYSLPTRLLDITSNPLIALYFACKTKEYESEDGEVIALSMDLDQIKYFDSDTASCIANLARLQKESKDAIDYTSAGIRTFNKQTPVKRLLHFIKEEKPFFENKIVAKDLRSVICVKGKRTNSRISFQSGAFLLFGQDAVLDERGTAEISVKRIAVTDKKAVLAQLDKLNINESTVFPHIENSARYIADKFKFKGT